MKTQTHITIAYGIGACLLALAIWASLSGCFLEMQPTPPTHRVLHGTVLDASGVPIGGVIIVAGGATTTSGESGEYQLPVPIDWSGEVYATKAGYSFDPFYTVWPSGGMGFTGTENP